MNGGAVGDVHGARQDAGCGVPRLLACGCELLGVAADGDDAGSLTSERFGNRAADAAAAAGDDGAFVFQLHGYLLSRMGGWLEAR